MTPAQKEEQHKTYNENSEYETSPPATATLTTTTTIKTIKEKQEEYLFLESSFHKCLERVVKVKSIKHTVWLGLFGITDSFVKMYKSLNLHNLESIDIKRCCKSPCTNLFLM